MPHAIVSVGPYAGTDDFGYDAMGNMTTRDEAGVSWIQPFNADGRLESVTDQGTSDAWDFVYNGDGVRVRQENPDGTTTLFIAGGSYEVVLDAQGEEVSIRKYYALGGQRVMREDDTNHYLLTDHLGSGVGIADEAGSLISEQRYMPYGLPRLEPGIGETDFGFTGQHGLEAVSLVDYNARWYSPSAGRWTQVDTDRPSPIQGGQAWNLFSYVSNNPIKFADPTGNKIEEGCGMGGPDNCELPHLGKDLHPESDGDSSAETGDGNSEGPITSMILRIPLSAETLEQLSTGLDVLAWILDLYSSGVVLYGGVVGAGIAAPFTLGGPEVPVVTGAAGAGIAELAVQTPLAWANAAATISTIFTLMADTKEGSTRIESLTVSNRVANSTALSTVGWINKEAFISLVWQTAAVSNDFGWTSLPWH